MKVGFVWFGGLEGWVGLEIRGFALWIDEIEVGDGWANSTITKAGISKP